MTRLCRLLHHKRDLPETSHDQHSVDLCAKDLFHLAVLADKYDATESIQLAGGYLLFHSASLRPKDIPIVFVAPYLLLAMSGWSRVSNTDEQR